MNVKKLGNFQNKRSLMGYKWSNLNAPGTENPLSQPIVKLGDFPFSTIWTCGGKNWLCMKSGSMVARMLLTRRGRSIVHEQECISRNLGLCKYSFLYLEWWTPAPLSFDFSPALIDRARCYLR